MEKVTANIEGSGESRPVTEVVHGEGGSPVIPQNQPMNQPGADNVKNPLGEETIRVRVKPGMSFSFQGDPVREGDEFDMPISMARNAAMYIDKIESDGTVRSVPTALQIGVPRANLAGLARHERVSELDRELKQLDERRAQVTKQLEHEHAEIEKTKRSEPVATVGTGVPATDAQAFPPGTPGGHGNTAVPPRSGEPGATVVTGPKGPAVLKSE